ncbi:MAG: hypothetical protein AAFY81_04015, partial [Pseudomonadota bacterium]
SGQRQNAASVRAFDGLGGWKEWACATNQNGLNFALKCEEQTGQLPTQAGLVSDGDAFLSRLAPITAETVYDAGCWNELLLAPKSGMPRTMEAMWAHYNKGGYNMIGTATDELGANRGDYKIWFDGRPRVLRRDDSAPNGTNRYSSGGITLETVASGEGLSDNPAYGFTPMKATLTASGETRRFDAILSSGC